MSRVQLVLYLHRPFILWEWKHVILSVCDTEGKRETPHATQYCAIHLHTWVWHIEDSYITWLLMEVFLHPQSFFCSTLILSIVSLVTAYYVYTMWYCVLRFEYLLCVLVCSLYLNVCTVHQRETAFQSCLSPIKLTFTLRSNWMMQRYFFNSNINNSCSKQILYKKGQHFPDKFWI